MDGVVGVSQCAIGPSESYTYRFRIDDGQFGTFWHVAFLLPGVVHGFPRRLNNQQLIRHRYHAHSGVQRADGLYGGLVVHEPANSASQDLSVYQQQPEHLLLIGDWYHRRAEAVFEWYRDPGHFGYEVWKAKGNLSVSSPWSRVLHTNTTCSLHPTHFSLTGEALTTAQWLLRRIQWNAA